MWSNAVINPPSYQTRSDLVGFQYSHKGIVLIFIQWICYSEQSETVFMQASVSSFIRSAIRLNSASLLRESKH